MSIGSTIPPARGAQVFVNQMSTRGLFALANLHVRALLSKLVSSMPAAALKSLPVVKVVL